MSVVQEHFLKLSVVSQCRSQRLPYQAVKKRLAHALSMDLSSAFGLGAHGTTLETAEKGVMYPILHFAPTSLHRPEQLSKEGITVKAMAEEYIIHQGLYVEVGRIQTEFIFCTEDHATESSSPQPTHSPAFILLGFKRLKSEQFQDMLEDSWKDWTGARNIYLNLPDSFGLSRIVFYKLLAPDTINLFSYVLLVECNHVTPKNQVFLRDFVQRLRADNMSNYMSMYRVWDGDNENPFRRHSSNLSTSDSGSDDLGSKCSF